MPQNSDLPLFISLLRLSAPWLFLPRIIVTLISAKVTTLIMRMCEGDLSHTKKGNNFRPDSTESNKEHGQGLGGSSLVRSTMICFLQVVQVYWVYLLSHFLLCFWQADYRNNTCILIWPDTIYYFSSFLYEKISHSLCFFVTSGGGVGRFLCTNKVLRLQNDLNGQWINSGSPGCLFEWIGRGSWYLFSLNDKLDVCRSRRLPTLIVCIATDDAHSIFF